MSKADTKKQTQEILNEHRELHALVDDLRAFLEKPRPELGMKGAHSWAAELSEQLVQLHDKLFRHFRHEIQAGIFQELSRRFPGKTSRIEATVGEHPGMLREVRELMDATLTYSQGELPDDPQLRRRLLKMLDDLARHEEEENDLIQTLMTHDVGGED